MRFKIGVCVLLLVLGDVCCKIGGTNVCVLFLAIGGMCWVIEGMCFIAGNRECVF